MRTLCTSLALAACAMAFAQNTATTTPQQDTLAYVKSTYDECLLAAGSSTWQAMGLTSEQVTRVSEMQTRYKQGGQAAAEAKAKADEKAAKEAAKANKTKNKSKVQKDAADKANGTSSSTTQPVEEKQTDPSVKDKGQAPPPTNEHGTLEKDAEIPVAVQPDQGPSPYDAELRTILTPEQFQMWER